MKHRSKSAIYYLCWYLVCTITIACTSVHEQFEQASRSGRVDALKEFIKDHPDSPEVDKAQKLIANIALNQARTKNSIQAYQQIIDQNPGNNHLYKLANSKIEMLAYEAAREKNTRQAYETFIMKFPFGKSKVAAQSHIETLEFQQAKKENSAQSYKKFLDMARYNQDDIKFAQKELEKAEFENASAANTADAYQKFIAKYQNSIYTIKATERLLNLRLPSTLYLSDKGHVSIQLGKINTISDKKLVATYGDNARQEFILSENTLVCSKSKKSLASDKLKSDLDVSIATIPGQDRRAAIAIYIGKTKTLSVRNNTSSNQPAFENFPKCFPPLSKK